MESDIPNQTPDQQLIQAISLAAPLTAPGFFITACTPAAFVLFLYNQQDIPGHPTSFHSPQLTIRETECPNIGRYANAKPVFSNLQAEPIPLINQIPVNNLNHESTCSR